VNGSVGRTASNRWEYRFDLTRDPLTGGRRVQTKGGFATKREATRALREAVTAAETGRSVTPSGRTLTQFFAEWHPAMCASLRPSTWENYGDYIAAYVQPSIGATRLQDLTAVRLNLLYGHLLERGRVKTPGGLAPKTVQNVHRMLHRAMKDAVKWGYLPRNIVDDAEAPRVRRHQPQVWTPAQMRSFVTSVQRDRFYALWLLVVTTGMRRGELAGLRRQDVDVEYGRVSPRVTRVVVAGYSQESDPKTAHGERTLALDPVTVAALRTYFDTWASERRLLGQGSPLLFVWPDGRPLHPDTITALFHKHVAAAGLPRIRLHDVRHSYATAALQAGVPAKVISERLGHATAAFTLQVYTHVIPGMDQDAADQIAALILGGNSGISNPDVRDLVRDRGISPLE
jgi:integrase